jgi:hypothetical protein
MVRPHEMGRVLKKSVWVVLVTDPASGAPAVSGG